MCKKQQISGVERIEEEEHEDISPLKPYDDSIGSPYKSSTVPPPPNITSDENMMSDDVQENERYTKESFEVEYLENFGSILTKFNEESEKLSANNSPFYA